MHFFNPLVSFTLLSATQNSLSVHEEGNAYTSSRWGNKLVVPCWTPGNTGSNSLPPPEHWTSTDSTIVLIFTFNCRIKPSATSQYQPILAQHWHVKCSEIRHAFWNFRDATNARETTMKIKNSFVRLSHDQSYPSCTLANNLVIQCHEMSWDSNLDVNKPTRQVTMQLQDVK